MMLCMARRAISFAAIFAALVLVAGVVLASESRVPLPQLTTAKGEQCVENTAFMRRNHMQLLKHQRDETVHRGIRTERHSLKNCLSCHAPEKPVAEETDQQHFCQSCHSYAGVRLDCFECHARYAEPKQ